MKTMKQLFTTIAILFFGVKCSSPTLPKLPADFEYTITEDKLDKGSDRRIVRVRLNKEVEQSVIKELSQWIKDNRTDATNMIIFYLVENSNYTSDVWLRIDYNPDYKVEIISTPKL